MGTFGSSFSPLLDSLAWTVIHSVWQGAMVALVYALSLFLIKDASRRYWVGLCCLCILPILQAATLIYCSRWSNGAGLDLPFTLSTDAAKPQVSETYLDISGLRALVTLPQESWLLRTARSFTPALFWIGCVWAVGVALYLFRFAIANFLLRQELQRCIPLSEDSKKRLQLLAERLSVQQPVEFVSTPQSSVPATCGWMRPVVLLPTPERLELPPKYLEAVVLHELAHIARKDSLTYQVRTVIGFLFFHHPLVRWLDRRMTDDSETAADDIASEAMGDSKTYASALLTLEETRMNSLKLGASGGSLRNRLLHVLSANRLTRKRPTKLSLLALVLSSLLILMACSEIVVRAASPDQKLLASLRRETLTESVLNALGLNSKTTNCTAELQRCLAEQESGSLSDQSLRDLADALNKGVEPDLITRHWHGKNDFVPRGARVIPGLGSGNARNQIRLAMAHLATQTTDPSLRSRLSRAASALLALDLVSWGSGGLNAWLRNPEKRQYMLLDSGIEHRLDFAIAIELERSQDAIAIHQGLANIPDETAIRGINAAAFQPQWQVSFGCFATPQDWCRLSKLLRECDAEVQDRWRQVFRDQITSSP